MRSGGLVDAGSDGAHTTLIIKVDAPEECRYSYIFYFT
jgi:hypothetical protein